MYFAHPWGEGAVFLWDFLEFLQGMFYPAGQERYYVGPPRGVDYN